jgi:hypothetical protein
MRMARGSKPALAWFYVVIGPRLATVDVDQTNRVMGRPSLGFACNG